MAGDWIKVERAVLTKPEVLEMAESLKIDRHAVLGKLLEVWFWFDEQTKDGNASNVTHVTLLRFIDERTGVTGFGAAMEKGGWLASSSIPKFDRHNGESAKKRAVTSKRVKRFRNGESVTPALPEKRREEGYISPLLDSKEPPNPNPSLETPVGPKPRAVAKAVLDFLNEKSGKAFVATEANLEFIVARLKEGYTSTQCRQVIVRKTREWGQDEKMAQYLRPATLFNREKFNQYAGELVVAGDPAPNGAHP